jgi:hypothetical protein
VVDIWWNSKKHHQDYAASLRTPGFEEFPTIPEYYDESTTQNPTFNMEMSAWIGRIWYWDQNMEEVGRRIALFR